MIWKGQIKDLEKGDVMGEISFINGNYTLNNPTILESSNSAEVDRELRFAGADSINLGLSYENVQGWYAGFLMHSLGSYPTNKTNTESLPGYTIFDFKLQVPASKSLAFNGSIENIFDQRFQLFPGIPNAGKIIQAGVSYNFFKIRICFHLTRE